MQRRFLQRYSDDVHPKTCEVRKSPTDIKPGTTVHLIESGTQIRNQDGSLQWRLAHSATFEKCVAVVETDFMAWGHRHQITKAELKEFYNLPTASRKDIYLWCFVDIKPFISDRCYVMTISEEEALDGVRQEMQENLNQWTNVFKFGDRIVAALEERMSGPDVADIALFQNTTLRFRTMCSGIGAVEEATGILNAAFSRSAKAAGVCRKFHSVSACEINKRCQEVLKTRHFHSGDSQHLHTDILKWLPQSVARELREIQETESKPFNKMKEVVKSCKLLPRAPCALHQFKACPREAVDFDFTGTICKDMCAICA